MAALELSHFVQERADIKETFDEKLAAFQLNRDIYNKRVTHCQELAKTRQKRFLDAYHNVQQLTSEVWDVQIALAQQNGLAEKVALVE